MSPPHVPKKSGKNLTSLQTSFGAKEMVKKMDHGYMITDTLAERPDDELDVVMFDTTDPRSVVNMVPEEIKEAMLAVAPKIWEQNESQLKRLGTVDATDCRLRLSFWDEYTRAQDKNVRMDFKRILKGICVREYFYSVILNNQQKVAFICSPPKDYIYAMREMLDLGMDQLRQILLTPFMYEKSVMQKNGEMKTFTVVDAKVMSEIRQTVQYLDQRVKGAIIQKMMIKQENTNLNVDAGREVLSAESLDDLEKLEKRLGRLKELTASTNAEVIDGVEDGTGSGDSADEQGTLAGSEETGDRE